MYKIENDTRFYRLEFFFEEAIKRYRFKHTPKANDWNVTKTFENVKQLRHHLCEISKTFDARQIAINDSDLWSSVERNHEVFDFYTLSFSVELKTIMYVDADFKPINPNDYVPHLKTVKSKPGHYGCADVREQGHSCKYHYHGRKQHNTYERGRQIFGKKYVGELTDDIYKEYSRAKRVAKMRFPKNHCNSRYTRRDCSWKQSKCRKQWSKHQPYKDTHVTLQNQHLVTHPSYFSRDCQIDEQDVYYLHQLGFAV